MSSSAPESDEIPWDRIVHWYGRATEVPETIRRLGSPNVAVRQQARDNLVNWLEHQDGLCHATPFAIKLLMGAVQDAELPERAAVLTVLEPIAKAALFQLVGPGQPPRDLKLADLLSPNWLWPEFESDEAEEILWEERDFPYEEFKAFQVLSARVLVDERPTLIKLVAEGHKIGRVAQSLLAIVDAIAASPAL
jgi:hypothetical protein